MLKAFIFPGQGSQSVGMGQHLIENFSCAQRVFEEASDAISLDIKSLCIEGPDTELVKTENTQPAIVTVSIATTEVLKQEFGVLADIVAGHSVGEYAACYTAGVLSLTDTIKSVRFRGQAMQHAVPQGEGAMAAFMGPSSQAIKDICAWVEEQTQSVLEPANFNAPGQTVISGHSQAVGWLIEHLEDYPWSSSPSTQPKRLKLIPLKVSAPFHCSLMKPAQEQMEEFLKNIFFRDANIHLIQNVIADKAKEANTIKDNLIRQVSSPVLWIESIERLKSFEVNEIFEVGSGQVLKGLNKKIWPEFNEFRSTQSLKDLKSLKH